VENDLKLNIPGRFYKDWSKSTDSMFVYLYASYSDRIEPADTAYKDFRYFESETQAIKRENELRALGYQTLLYKTAGTSGVLLSSKMLSYPDEAIAFIVFHEAVHNDLRTRKKRTPPYVYEEALCDAVANYACLRFAEKTKMLNKQKVLKQKAAFESLYKMLNANREKLDKLTGEKRKAVLVASQGKIKAVTTKANRFVKDRMHISFAWRLMLSIISRCRSCWVKKWI
jgi:predicted aminopeptidase